MCMVAHLGSFRICRLIIEGITQHDVVACGLPESPISAGTPEESSRCLGVLTCACNNPAIFSQPFPIRL